MHKWLVSETMSPSLRCVRGVKTKVPIESFLSISCNTYVWFTEHKTDIGVLDSVEEIVVIECIFRSLHASPKCSTADDIIGDFLQVGKTDASSFQY